MVAPLIVSQIFIVLWMVPFARRSLGLEGRRHYEGAEGCWSWRVEMERFEVWSLDQPTMRCYIRSRRLKDFRTICIDSFYRLTVPSGYLGFRLGLKSRIGKTEGGGSGDPNPLDQHQVAIKIIRIISRWKPFQQLIPKINTRLPLLHA